MKEEDTVEGLGLTPVVTLVVVDEFGQVRLLEHVGNSTLVDFLKHACKLKDNPITSSDSLLDCRGQEVYVLKDLKYFKSITGFFLSSPNYKELSSLCSKDGLVFSFIVSY